MSLKELQNNMILNLLQKDNDFDVEVINQEGGVTALERLDVHRQTIIENLVNSIAIIYPGIWKLLGIDCARGVALSYIHEMIYLPINGVMEEFGSNFSDYLAAFPSTKDIVYIKDFATYEWLKSESYHAKFVKGVGFEQLGSLTEEDLNSAKFILGNSVQFLTSDYALDDIQRVLDNPESEFISLSKGKYFFVIYQKQGKVTTSRVTQKLWSFLREMQAGNCFGVVVDKYKENVEFDLASYLAFMVQHDLVQQIISNKQTV